MNQTNLVLNQLLAKLEEKRFDLCITDPACGCCSPELEKDVCKSGEYLSVQEVNDLIESLKEPE